MNSGLRDLPDTRYLMKRAGYTFLNTSNCKKCGDPTEWWKTTRGKTLGFNLAPNDETEMVLHFTVCKPKPQTTPAAKTPEVNIDKLVRDLCQRTQARVVAVVVDGDTYTYWRKGLPAEDLRTELILAGNQVRDLIHKEEVA